MIKRIEGGGHKITSVTMTETEILISVSDGSVITLHECDGKGDFRLLVGAEILSYTSIPNVYIRMEFLPKGSKESQLFVVGTILDNVRGIIDNHFQ